MVIFVCTQNAGRSQMAAALLEGHGLKVASAGTNPADKIHPNVVKVMAEVGINISDRKPQALTEELAKSAAIIVTMGCGDACPYFPDKQYIDWNLPDPAHMTLGETRILRDLIQARVEGLQNELQANCDCVPVFISSKSCRKCGRKATITADHFNEICVDVAQYHYVLRQIEEGVPDAQDMARRVLAGERSVRPELPSTQAEVEQAPQE